MTLVLSFVARKNAIQVSDRLLTRVRRDAMDPFDASSNKSIIFRARDGLFLIGYSGRAYIDHMPTDSWIAQSLAGVELRGRFMTRMVGQGNNWLNIGPTAYRLRSDLERSFARLRSNELAAHPMHLSIVGWRVTRRRACVEPVVCELIQVTSRPHVDIRWQRSNWDWVRRYTVVVEPEHHFSNLTQMRAELKSRAHQSPEVCESILVEAIRERSRADPTVGSDCLAVRFGPAWKHIVRFIPGPAAQHQPIDLSRSAYSPWIIAPPIIMAPSVTTGGWDTANLSWSIAGLEEQTFPRTAFQYSQTRPAEPQR